MARPESGTSLKVCVASITSDLVDNVSLSIFAFLWPVFFRSVHRVHVCVIESVRSLLFLL